MRGANLIAAISALMASSPLHHTLRSAPRSVAKVLPKVLWDSSRKGTYRNPHKRARRDAIRAVGIRQYKRIVNFKGAF